jgi:hypothetical protein
MINSNYVALAAMSVVLLGAFILVRFGQKPQSSRYVFQQQSNAPPSSEGYMPSVPSAIAGDVAVFDSLGNVRDSSYIFSDSVTSPNAIWSGQRVANEIGDALQAQISDGTTGTSTTWSSSAILSNLTAVADVLKPAPGVAGNLLNFSSRGTIQDSGLVVDDTKLDKTSLWSSKGVIDNVINDASVQRSSTWSSTKLSSAFASKDASPSKTLLVGSGDGNFVSSGFTVDDTLGPASNIIWSSERVEAGKAKIEDGSVNPSTTWSSKQIVDTIEAAANVLNQNAAVAGTPGHVAQLGVSGNVVDSGFTISDSSAASANVLWTSARFKGKPNSIASFDADGNFTSSPLSTTSIMNVSTAATGNLLTSASGQAGDSGVSFGDTEQASKSVVWTSQGVLDNILVDSKISTSSTWSSDKIATAISGAKAIISDGTTSATATWSSDKISTAIAGASQAATQALTEGAKISDSSTNAGSTWSSDKISSEISSATNIKSAAGQILVANASGTIVGSGVSVNDASPASSTVVWTSDKIIPKISPAVAGDFVSVNADGTISDSGFKVDDVLVGGKILWTSDKISSAIGSLTPAVVSSKNLISVSNGSFTDSGFAVDDEAVSPSTLWSSSKISSLFLPRLSGSIGNILTNGANGVAATSSFSIDDSLPASNNILWSSQKAKDSFVSSKGLANSIVSFDSNGNATSNISVNDSSSGTGVLWSSSKIQSKLDAISQFATSYTVNDSATTASNIWTAQQVQNAVSAAVAVSVAFDAASDQNFSSLNTPITYNITTLNTGNGLNSSSGKFTAPKTGFYFLHWQGVQNDNQGLDVRVFLKLNGSTIMGSYSYQTRHNQLVMSCVRRLNVNDSVWAEINQGSISSSGSDLFTKFSGFML